MTSFDFKWDKSQKPSPGKVIARKKATQKANENNKPPISKPIETNKTTPQPAAKKPFKKFDQPNNPEPNKLVKRKQKKDKIVAKNLLKEGDDSGLKSIQTAKQTQHSLFSEKKGIHINRNIQGKSIVEKVFSENKKFDSLNIHKYIVSNLNKHSFVTLTNVQEKTIPVILSGQDVLIRSQTGSGKTLAYAVPILDALVKLTTKLQRSDGVQAIIVVPTRELALQTDELFRKINTFQWIVVGHLCGGENRKTEKDRLKKGVHILIATPGRLLDHMLHTAAFKTSQVRCLVLDEADRLLDMGFKKDIIKIVEELDKSQTNSSYDPMAILKNKSSKPTEEEKTPKRQTLLLSATLTKGIAELADFTMKEHIYLDALDEASTVNPEHMVIPNTVKQEFLMLYVKHKLFTLSALIAAKSKQNSKTFIFMATSQMVDYHHELFSKYLLKLPKNRGKLKSGDIVLLENIQEESDDDEEEVLDVQLFKLHGNMEQSLRKEVFKNFREAKKGVLICTDVAARGIDVPEADCIVQYTGPQSDEDYLHRVGRTGRAGKSGSAILFLTHEEQDYVTRLQQHKVFLKEHDPEDFLKHLCDLMEEPDHQKAATALQRRYEEALLKDKELHRKACFAYSSWSRFYNTYPNKLREIFDFKTVNLGHYVTSFAIKDTPTQVARIVRGQVSKTEPARLNRKLAIHQDEEQPKRPPPKRKIKSVSLTTSEFASGLAPSKKKKKAST